MKKAIVPLVSSIGTFILTYYMSIQDSLAPNWTTPLIAIVSACFAILVGTSIGMIAGLIMKKYAERNNNKW